MGMWLYTKRTLLDYLHRPCIRRGQLSRFLFWVPWEVFHTVLCLIIYIGRTSFGGDSYRVFFLGSLWSFSHGTLPDYVHRRYIFRRGELSPFFSGFPGKFEWFEARWRQNVPTGIRTRDRGDLTSLRLAAARSDYPRFLFWRYSAWLFTSSVPLSQGRAIAFFFRGFLGSFSHGTLPDYLHRPYLFGRGELSRFFFWVSWEVFHTELCLILDSVGFFLWFSMTKWVTGLA